jgi:prevent-host-death family protein
MEALMHTSVKNLRDHLSDYLRHVRNGEEVIITSHMKPVAKITPIEVEAAYSLSCADMIAEITALHRTLKGVKLKGTMREAVIKSRNEERS